MSENKNLYAISKEQEDIYNQIANLDGEMTPELEEALALTEKNRNQKSMAYLEVIKSSEARTIMAKELKARAEQVLKQESRKQDYLKGNLLDYIKKFGAFEVGIQKFGTRKSTSVEVLLTAEELPEKFVKVVVSKTIDKTKIKESLKDGKKIDGCSLKENINLKIN